MGKLLKYEFRKSMGINIALLALTALYEIYILIGAYFRNDAILMSRLIVLFGLAGVATVAVIVLTTIKTYKKDITTNRGYMLFLTPNSGYKILGSKLLELLIVVLVGGAIFTSLMVLNTKLLCNLDIKEGSLFVELSAFSYVAFSSKPVEVTLLIVSILVWIVDVVALACASASISATLLNGRKFSGVASVGIFIAIYVAVGKIFQLAGLHVSIDMLVSVNKYITVIIVHAVVAAIFYYVSSWLIQNKLSI